MILKLVNSSKFTLFCKVLTQTSVRNIHASEISLASDAKSDHQHSYFTTDFGKRVRRPVVRINQEQIDAVKAVLRKHNVDVSNLDDKSDIFHDTPWEIEKKIMILEEIGSSNITTKTIIHFREGLKLPVQVFKAHMQLDPNTSIVKNLFSRVDDYSYDIEKIVINENQLTKNYLHECLIHYCTAKLELNKSQARKMKIRKDYRVILQSFRLFSKLLQFLQDNIVMTKNKILKHHVWLFSQHPDQMQVTYDLVGVIGKERTKLIIQRYPPIFEHNLEDLQIIVSFLKDHVGISKRTSISSIISVFRTTSDELKKRFEYLSKNPFTQDFLKHPKFINLIVLYHCILPRLRYLEEKNLQYVTIYSLTSFLPNYHDELANFKRLNKNDIESFFSVHFGNDAEKALKEFKKNMYYRFVPLLCLKKSLVYLREKFPYEIVRDNSYAILYSQVDLEAAYEVVTKNTDYCDLPPNQLLTMCLYTIEVSNHFVGDAILAPGKYAESLKENVDQDKEIDDK